MRRPLRGRPRLVVLLLAGGLQAMAPAAQPAVPATKKLDVTRPEVRQFIDSMATRHEFAREALAGTLAGAVTQGRIVESMSRPAERTMQWWEYRQRFLTDERINAGLDLWEAQAPALERIAAHSGVPAEYLLAITGVETFYGRIMGRNRVLDALVTLAFDYPARSAFFTKELEEYLLIARDEGLDPREPVGSYAGAMGAPQFMPSSMRRYAVDGNGDGHRDLWKDWTDVFASVANYFTEHGWQRGEPVLAEVSSARAADDPANARLALDETVDGLRSRGYAFDTALPGSASAMLVPAPQEDSLQWRVGFRNFYVITRYNRSMLYAMAVNDLAQALADGRRARQQALGATPGTAPQQTPTG